MRFAEQADLVECIRLLRQRHESILAATKDGQQKSELRQSLLSLQLAEAFLDKGKINQLYPQHPPQIAVIGPTQAGKSTLVNLLLGEDLARVSPLAGFTVHPQGFAFNVDKELLNWVESYFGDYYRYPLEDLPSDRYDAYALEHSSRYLGHPLRGGVIWDTPDFDSVKSDRYLPSALRTAALADVVLLVVSKDKYADQTVWELMRLLEPLGQPVGICLNKVPFESRDALLHSLEEKWRGTRHDTPVGYVCCPYFSEDPSTHSQAWTSVKQELVGLVNVQLRQIQRQRHTEHIRRLLRQHWPLWTQPARREQEARLTWEGLVDTALQQGMAQYRRDFLDHPLHYETFQKALAELLTLLEVPGLAKVLITTRKLVSWPLKKLVQYGKSLSSKERDTSRETAVLQHTAEHLFIRLGEAALAHHDQTPALRGWWREVGQLLRSEYKAQVPVFENAVLRYQQSFQPEIEIAANQLYQELGRHPSVLNSLRATRLTTDAAALAVALHTGGIGLHDFILAPAILSLTGLLTEGALGHYLKRVEVDLKRRQFNAVEGLFDRLLRPLLLQLPDRLEGADKFNLAPERFTKAEAFLRS